MFDPRTYNRHREKTQASLRKIIVKFEPHARHDSRDAMEITCDELRALLLCLQRADGLLAQAAELVEKQQKAENTTP